MKSRNHLPLYSLMNEIGETRFRIQLICDYPCEDKYQLKQKEGEYIRDLGTLNKRIAGRTQQQYQEEHKEYYQEVKKKSAEKHKEENIVRKQLFYINNKKRILQRQKELYEQNKEKINAKKKEYYEKNKINLMHKVKNDIYRRRKHYQLIIKAVSQFFLNILFDFDVKSIIKESCLVSVEYSNNVLKSSSLTYALISGYICSTTD
jgi:hypothetical protein